MAGNPLKRAFFKRLAEFGGIERVLDLIRDGGTVIGISKELGFERHFLSKELNRPGVIGAYKEALAQAAHAYAEMAIEESKLITPETANAAKQRQDALRWAAKVRDPETYGEKHGTSVHVDMRQLTIDAYRKFNKDKESIVSITPQIEATKEIEGAD
jgi:hypothetical protein